MLCTFINQFHFAYGILISICFFNCLDKGNERLSHLVASVVCHESSLDIHILIFASEITSMYALLFVIMSRHRHI